LSDSIVLAIGLVLVIEGLFPLFFTESWKEAFIRITNQKKWSNKVLWTFISDYWHNDYIYWNLLK